MMLQQLAKVAAASVDDVFAQAGPRPVKGCGAVIDDCWRDPQISVSGFEPTASCP